MWKSVFSGFQIQPKGGGQHVPGIDSRPDIGTSQEEDGFLIVGETASEKSTVTHQQFVQNSNTQCQTNSPPNYEAVISRGMSDLSPLNTVPSNNNHMLPISDIPFQLAPQLTILQRLSKFTSNQAQRRTEIDWAKYDYDFTFEINYLKEHGFEPSEVKIDQQRDLIKF